MDTTLVGAFASSAQATFKEMFGLEAIAAAPRDLGSQEEHSWDITGLIGLAGEAQGIVALRLTHGLAVSLLASTGVSAGGEKEMRELEGGLVGEMINIIAGHATSSVSDLNMEIAPPVVVRGPNHRIGWPSIGPVVAIDFKLPVGSFEIDLCVKR
jgi:chemotaxis protein CheX